MDTPPKLTDRAALDRQRRRAAAAPALFLQERLADEVEDRLLDVNRTFTDRAVVSPWPQLWAERLPGARVLPDTEILDLEENSLDLVVHALCLHWADDPIGQIVQCARALRPDGLLVATAFGGRTLEELRAALAQAESRITGGLAPRVAPMAEIRDMGALLQRAGLALPVADSHPWRVTYETPLELMRDLRAMGEGNALASRHRAPLRRNVLMEAARIYQESYGQEDGRIPATFEVVTLTGWRPDESQQKPLRPGSARHSLSEALGATERPLDPSSD